MKQYLFATVIIVFLSSFIIPLKKNNIKSIRHYFEYSFALTKSDGTPDINLERSSAVYQITKSKTAPAVLNITGGKSSIRLKSGNPQFIAHPAAGETATTAAEINLYKLSSDKKNRILSLDPTGVISSEKVILTVVQADVQTLKLLITNGNLSTGEYAFVEKNMVAANSNLTVWCFGID